MASWEYTVIPLKTRIHSNRFEGSSKPVIEDVQNDLNDLGKEGWELVSVQDVTLLTVEGLRSPTLKGK